MGDIPERPKVRGDLVFVEHGREGAGDGNGDVDGECYHVVKDRISDRYFRIGRAERRIIDLLDGTRTPGEVLSAIGPDAGIDLEEIESFARQLDGNHLLETGRPEDRTRRPAAARDLSIFHLRMKVVNPDGIVGVLAKHLGFLVSVPGLIAAAVPILLAVLLTCSELGVLVKGATVLKDPLNIALFYVIVSVIMTIHEFGHAIALKKLGGDVKEMGFMLLYFMPCFYTDVSDIYMMGKRSQRMAVIVAGPLAELATWSVFTIGYFFLPKGNGLSTFLYLVMIASGVKSILLNANPMIKMDGYYLLEEILDVVNLMQRSRARLVAAIAPERRRRGAGENGGDEEDDAGNSAREDRVLLIYGILSFAYVVSMIIASACFAALLAAEYIGAWSWGLSGVAAAVLLALFLRTYRRGGRRPIRSPS